MHTDARTLAANTILRADVCIIGAGAAGLTLAQALHGSPLSVCLLESGGFQGDPHTQFLYHGLHIGQPDHALAAARLRFFGGATNHWDGFCSRLDPIDLVERPWVPYSGWPINWEDLAAHYPAAHAVCDLGPYTYAVDDWEAPAQGYGRLPFAPNRLETKIYQFSPPTRFGAKYRTLIERSKNIHLFTNANVVRLAHHATGGHLTGVDVATLEGTRLHVQAQQYVLACGGVENARLLLASNDVIPAGVGNEHDTVGRFFIQHPHVQTGTVLLDDRRTNIGLYREHEQHKTPIRALLRLADAVQRREQTLNYSVSLADQGGTESGYVSARSIAHWIKDGTLGTAYGEALLNALSDFDALIYGLNQNMLGQHVKTPRMFHLKTRLDQAPNPHSRVILDHAHTDALGMPRVLADWQLTALDRHTLRVANDVLAQELARTGMGRLVAPPWICTDDAWPEGMTGGYHHMGTTRMTEDPTQGVVDANARLHTVDNLYVAGSSIFTTAGCANPTLTIVALTLRLADHLHAVVRPERPSLTAHTPPSP
ncbi:FAD-dependent oxidoreductase [Salisaeta longa]|uniref:FAD-dependent oxidoreductase n=1 Tax=Salisaeta longa TaxID=503170 RepID=UPI0003B6397B|nr:GMC family oxidoreductase [Salisaeta longa]